MANNYCLFVSFVSFVVKFPKMKTKPKQTQFKAKQSQFFWGFWRKNFNFSLKIDDTKLNLLCKTKPIYENSILSRSFQKTLNMQNEPNGMLFKTKTNPIFSSGFFHTVSGNERRFILIIIGFCGILNSYIWPRRSKLTRSFRYIFYAPVSAIEPESEVFY